VIFPLSSSHGLAERESIKRMTAATDIYCQTGPLSVIVIP
jgi:hypothetical protein